MLTPGASFEACLLVASTACLLTCLHSAYFLVTPSTSLLSLAELAKVSRRSSLNVALLVGTSLPPWLALFDCTHSDRGPSTGWGTEAGLVKSRVRGTEHGMPYSACTCAVRRRAHARLSLARWRPAARGGQDPSGECAPIARTAAPVSRCAAARTATLIGVFEAGRDGLILAGGTARYWSNMLRKKAGFGACI